MVGVVSIVLAAFMFLYAYDMHPLLRGLMLLIAIMSAPVIAAVFISATRPRWQCLRCGFTWDA